MLFLPALLFFILGTGISALAAGSESSESDTDSEFLGIAVIGGKDGGRKGGLDKNEDYERAQGYWRPETNDEEEPLVAYIGDGHPLVFHSGQRRNTKVAWDGKRSFVRILTAAEYFEYIHEEYPRRKNGNFLEIKEAYRRDRLMIWLVESPRSEDHIFAHMKLHHSPADGFIRSMTVENVKYGVNQGYQRGHGYWRPNRSGNDKAEFGSVLVYIGPEKDGPMKLDYDDEKDLLVVARRKRTWLRVLNKDEYEAAAPHKKCPDNFKTIPNAEHGHDKATINIYLIKSDPSRVEEADTVSMIFDNESKSEDLMDVDSPAGEFRHSMTIGTVTYIGMAGYEQGHGYWGPYKTKANKGFVSVLAYIGPEKNGPMKLYYDNSKDLAIVGKRKRWWFRVLNKDEYKKAAPGKKCPDDFQTIPNAEYGHDITTIYLVQPKSGDKKSGDITEPNAVTMRLEV